MCAEETAVCTSAAVNAQFEASNPALPIQLLHKEWMGADQQCRDHIEEQDEHNVYQAEVFGLCIFIWADCQGILDIANQHIGWHSK